MSRIDDRVAELGLIIPAVSKPVAAYIPAVVTGNLVFTSGQLPMVDGELPDQRQGGRRGGCRARAPARPPVRAQRPCRGAQSAIGSLDRITRVVKVVGFVASDP